jgi:beta-glucanase (GH16 family)
VTTLSSQCGPKCVSTTGCTHFTWTTYQSGTCWMKSGKVSQSDAFQTNDNSMVCGIVPSSSPLTTLLPTSTLSTAPPAILWSDEFNYNGVPNSNWIPDIGGGGWGNNELEYYTNNLNTNVSSGYLKINTLKQSYGGRNYTSARLVSSRNFTYGVFEMRAKLPKGRGTWPAFWLLSAKRPLQWPLNGEIDIMEAVGFETSPNIYATIHCQSFYGANGKGNHIAIADPYNTFHTYKADWNSQRIKFYVDNQLYFTYSNDNTGNVNTWPFNGPVNIILNNAVGGNWGGAKGVDDSIFPTQYTIDFIRQYAPNKNP